ncbi:MAG: hypothetical protein P8107_15615 [Spirochaetia bacterium]|jgi:hypothetical protein
MYRYPVILLIITAFIVACPGGKGNGPAKKSEGAMTAAHPDPLSASKEKLNYASMDPVPLPRDFPEGVYLYAGAKTIAGFHTAENYAVTLYTPDDIKTIVASYKERAKLEQWKELKVLTLSDQTVIKYKAGDHAVTVRVTREAAGSLIALTVR